MGGSRGGSGRWWLLATALAVWHSGSGGGNGRGGVAAIDYTHDQLQYQSVGRSGAYNFGYDTGVFGAHSFHQQWRDEDGEVRGRFGYTDPNGDLRITHYKAGRDGYRILMEKVEPGNPVRAGPRPPPGSGDSLVVPGEGVVSRRLTANQAARPLAHTNDNSLEDISNYRNALAEYPAGGARDDYVIGKTRYYVPYRQAGELGRPAFARRPPPNGLSKFDRYFRRPVVAQQLAASTAALRRPVYYKDGRPLGYDPFAVYAQRAGLGYNPFVAA